MVDVPSTNLVFSFSNIEVNAKYNPSANLALSMFAPTVVWTDNRSIAIPSANLYLTVPGLIFIQGVDLVLSSSVPVMSMTGTISIEVPTGDLILSVGVLTVRKVIPWISPDDNPNLLCPTNINVKLSSDSVSPPGRSLTGKKQIIQVDSGFWIIVLEGIRIRTKNDVHRWREIEGGLNGRANTALIPIPSEDNTIVATANADVAIGTTTVFINVSSGNDPEEGMHFSVGIGRLYRIKEIVDDVGPVFEVRVRPPIREAIASGDSLNFVAPECLCRLMFDDGMNITHELLRISTPTVIFREDWVT